MSHVVTLALKIRNRVLLADIAREKGYAVKEHDSVRFWNGRTVEGMTITLPGWRYPVVVDEEGSVHYDNYNGSWGNTRLLNHLLQEYVAAEVRRVAQQENAVVLEQTREDGSLVLTITMGGW